MAAHPLAAVLATIAAVAGLAAERASAQDAPAPAPAAVPDSPPASLDSVIRDLGDQSVQVRLRASTQLAEGPYPLRQLEAVLGREALSPEQRHRVLAAARRRFDSEPRGAMGIQFGDPPDSRGVLIAAPRREFHAFEVLRPRDRLLKADGIVLDRRETLQKIIVSHDPGESVPLVVERDGATLELTVRLGEFAQLRQPPATEVWAAAWEHRSRAYASPPGVAPERPVESGLLGDAWLEAPEVADEADLMVLRAKGAVPGPERSRVVAGGEPRLGIGPVISGQVARIDAVFRGPMVAPGGRGGNDLRDLWARRSDLTAQQLQLRQLMTNPQQGQGVRRQIRVQIDMLQTQIAALDAEIARRNRVPADLRLLPGPAPAPAPR